MTTSWVRPSGFVVIYMFVLLSLGQAYFHLVGAVFADPLPECCVGVFLKEQLLCSSVLPR